MSIHTENLYLLRSKRKRYIAPTHHATRYCRHRGSVRSVHPDGFGALRAGGRTYPFFLEWERRALHPSTMAARLGPYLRYYSTNQPLDDHGHRPMVLAVFDDYLTLLTGRTA